MCYILDASKILKVPLTPISFFFLPRQTVATPPITFAKKLRISNIQLFHWLAGQRLSVHITFVPNMVKERDSNKAAENIDDRNLQLNSKGIPHCTHCKTFLEICPNSHTGREKIITTSGSKI